MDFLSSLDTNIDDIEKPLDPPVGTYQWQVTKIPTRSNSASGEWAIVEFAIKAISAEEDVDPDELEEFGPVTGIQSRISFMAPTDPEKTNDQAKTRDQIKNFCVNVLQLDDDGNPPLSELMDNSAGSQFLGTLSLRRTDDNVFIDVKRPAPLD
jgi:hypothetical protein